MLSLETREKTALPYDDITAKPIQVGLLGAPFVVTGAVNQYLEHTGQTWENWGGTAADVVSEFSGRVCYQSFDNPRPGGSPAYFDRIKQERHGSILEHANFTFIITGVSRNLTHELVRHRAGFGFSQLSQRYVAADKTKFVPPYEFWESEEWFREWAITCRIARNTYIRLVEKMEVSPKWPNLTKTDRRKHIRQAARCVLPGSAETHIVVTANLRAWRHFLDQRGSPGADQEIRMLAIEIATILKDVAPQIMSDVKHVETDDGLGGIEVNYRKI